MGRLWELYKEVKEEGIVQVCHESERLCVLTVRIYHWVYFGQII